MPKQFVIYGAKQVGRLSHFTKDISVLTEILRSGKLLPGESEEYNPNTDTFSRYISFSRDLLAPMKRSSKWKYGLILDGNAISESYNIAPYSYEWINNKSVYYKIKVLTAYDDNTYSVQFVRKNTTAISESCYNQLKAMIFEQSDTFNTKCKLEHQTEGKRRVNGHMIKEKYIYNNPQGGVKIAYSELPLELKPFIDEYEERFWETSKQKFIKLTGKIVSGLILPKTLKEDFESGNADDLLEIRNLMDNLCGVDNYTIMYY